MNDVNFIIISSDEETDTNSTTKTQEETIITEGSVEPVVHEVDSSKNKNASVGSSNQEKAQYFQTTIDGIEISLSENPISEESLNDIQELNHSKYCTKQTNIKTEAESENKKNNETDTSVKMTDTFSRFLHLVLSMEEKESDKARLEKKITKYYNLTDSKYLRSEEFQNMLENSMQKLVKDQAFLYFIVKEVLDCLLSNRVITEYKKQQKLKSSTPGEKDSKKERCEENHKEEDEVVVLSDKDVKVYKTIKKLTKMLRKLEKKIKELEDTEVDLSDEEDSVYLKMQRFRERYCQIHKKLCSYTKQEATAKRAYIRKISFTGTKNLRLNQAIETWLNKTMEFPDYASVLKFLQQSNDNLVLKMSEEELKTLAVDVFNKIGNSLQLRRKYDLWDSLNSFLHDEIDPSISDTSLKEILDSNFELASKKESEILKYYADLQVNRSLEPLEVPDEEANKSPVESGDEDENELEAVENELSLKIPIETYDKSEESDAEESDQEDCNSNPAFNTEAAGEESKPSCTTMGPECVSNCSDEHKGSGRDDFSNSTACANLAGAIQENSERDAENCETEVFRMENVWQEGSGRCVKKAKLTNAESCDDNSDCELITILSDEDTNFKFENDDNCKIRKMHQINYAFTNNNFNHNATLTAYDILQKRKRTPFTFKSGKIQRRPLSIPLSDLTNIKHITSKYSWLRGGLEKRKFQESIRLHPFERSRFKYSQLILPDKISSNHCALQNGCSEKNVKSQNENDQLSEKDSCEETSNGQGINAPNNGASGGGNGKDDNEDDRRKKPWDQEKRFEDGQAPEDEDENELEEDEVAGYSRNKGDFTAGERNSNVPVASQPGRGKGQTGSQSDSVASFSRLQTFKTDPPQSKQKSPKTKKIPSNGMKAYRNRGGIPDTTKFPSVKYPLGCKPCENIVKPARNRARQTYPLNPPQKIESVSQNEKRQPKSAKVAKTDEEIVKNFLQHSPSSISITSPRKRVTENKPSPSVLKAMETLSRLKGITTTVVRGSCSEREEDVIVVGESPNNAAKRNNKTPTPKSGRKPDYLLPKIVTVQGNVTGFDSLGSDANSDNVNTKFPVNKDTPKRRRFRGTPCPNATEIRGNNSDNQRQIKSTRKPAKNVEYVVLE